MIDFTDTDSNYRLYREFIFRRKDPYGFWYIEASSGKTPGELVDKAYTTTDQAKTAIDVYIKNSAKATNKRV